MLGQKARKRMEMVDRNHQMESSEWFQTWDVCWVRTVVVFDVSCFSQKYYETFECHVVLSER